MDKLIDRFGRKIDYLRISVTDRCNLRCVYCMPSGGILRRPHSEILSFEEIHRIVNVAVRLGISKVRITGGEPLVRKGLALLIKNLKRINGLNEIALTTNGVYLKEQALSLKEAGLDRINISLDSLVPEKFQEITRGGNLKSVLEGIGSGLSAGFSPIKINVVLMKAFNAQEVLDFANLTRTRPLHVRFIEYMPTYLSHFPDENIFFSCAEAKDMCSSMGELNALDSKQPSTAKAFRIKGFCGTIGFISPISRPFCFSCNKIRLTSYGCLRSCLHSSRTVDLKSAMGKGCSDEDLAMLIKEAVSLKPESHNLLNTPLGVDSENFSMCQIGG